MESACSSVECVEYDNGTSQINILLDTLGVESIALASWNQSPVCVCEWLVAISMQQSPVCVSVSGRLESACSRVQCVHVWLVDWNQCAVESSM